MQISIGMSIIVVIWAFVGMIKFMLGQAEYDISRFYLRVWVSYAVLWEASSVLHLGYALIGLKGMQTGLIHFTVVI